MWISWLHMDKKAIFYGITRSIFVDKYDPYRAMWKTARI